MPWYYAGPEAKPVGPVSTEELHARHLNGVISPETYIIEHTGQSTVTGAWKHYREIFPANPSLPPPPPVPFSSTVPPPPPAPLPSQPSVAPHPLFPSAAPVPTGTSPFTSPPRPDPYYMMRRTNPCCAWGFGLSFAGFIFSFVCGTGLLLALPGILLCIMGMVQVGKHKDQSGQGLSIAGLILSLIALLISFAIILIWAVPLIKAHEQTATEQTPNDSQ